MNESNIRIEEASPSDLDVLVCLVKDLFAIERDFELDESRQRRCLALMLERDESRCIMVVKMDGKGVGGKD
jgi:hypothetical protein